MGHKQNVKSSNETLMVMCIYEVSFNFGDSKWDVEFPNKQF